MAILDKFDVGAYPSKEIWDYMNWDSEEPKLVEGKLALFNSGVVSKVAHKFTDGYEVTFDSDNKPFIVLLSYEKILNERPSAAIWTGHAIKFGTDPAYPVRTLFLTSIEDGVWKYVKHTYIATTKPFSIRIKRENGTLKAFYTLPNGYEYLLGETNWLLKDEVYAYIVNEAYGGTMIDNFFLGLPQERGIYEITASFGPIIASFISFIFIFVIISVLRPMIRGIIHR